MKNRSKLGFQKEDLEALENDLINNNIQSFFNRMKVNLILNQKVGSPFIVSRFFAHKSHVYPDFFKKFFHFLQQRIYTKDSLVFYLLGVCTCKGAGTEANPTKSIEYFELQPQFSGALSFLGFCYHDGRGVQKNFEKAVMYHTKGQLMGNSTSILNLGCSYESGEGVAKDIKKAVELYNISSKMGNPHGMFNLGCCYLHGHGVDQDIKKAIDLFQIASEQNHTESVEVLADFFKKGNGVEKDTKKAFNLLFKAFEIGSAYAGYALGYYYEKGDDVEQNYVKARKFYLESAKLKHHYGFFKAYEVLLRGIGGKKDLVRVWKILNEASLCEKCVLHVQYGMHLMSRRKFKEAADSFLKGVNSEQYEANFWYGYCLIEGLGVEKNVLNGMEMMSISRNYHQSLLASVYPSNEPFIYCCYH